MPNRAMEFHDSTFDGFDQDGQNLTLRFSAAYIHESDGKPGLDAGVDWIQEVRLHFENASITGSRRKLRSTKVFKRFHIVTTVTSRTSDISFDISLYFSTELHGSRASLACHVLT